MALAGYLDERSRRRRTSLCGIPPDASRCSPARDCQYRGPAWGRGLAR